MIKIYPRFPVYPGELYYGSYPSTKDLYEVKEYGVTVIWNLAYELFDLAEEESKLFDNVVFSAISDFNVPTNYDKFSKEVDIICEHIKNDRKVFVHCYGGRGRTGMALAIIAKVLYKANSDQALNLAKKYCDGPEVDKQVEFVRNFV